MAFVDTLHQLTVVEIAIYRKEKKYFFAACSKNSGKEIERG